ncbi:hypothetical protein Nepgr_004990 [Nepenthes gracilis]|uniref:PUM-HD domain-containing protein n=1 Tax=Nepenthes gracilis TaxID=150966 RepID=A0AAD3XG26_NEPGR|nr:hypothetical protein Nepgr_004990 [Nepenthes gracilis]
MAEVAVRVFCAGLSVAMSSLTDLHPVGLLNLPSQYNFMKMATENPIRMMEAREKWPSHKEAATYASSSMVVDETLLGKGNMYCFGRATVPNRSGSAPPNMEGSLAAIGNLMHGAGSNYSSVSHGAGGANNGRSTSVDDCSNNSMFLIRGTLPTHKEESEDDRSPRRAFIDWTERSSPLLSGQESILQRRSLVKLTREQFSPTPAAVYHQSHFHSLCHGSDCEVVNPDDDYSSLHNQSISVSNAVASDINVEDIASLSDGDFSGSSASTLCKEDDDIIDFDLKDNTLACDDSSISSIQSGIEALKICPPNVGNHSSQEGGHHILPHNLVQHLTQQQQYNFQFQGSMAQIVSQGIDNGGMLSSSDVQPMLQSSGFTPLYATAAAYMPSENPYYSGVQPPGIIYSPQFGIGGYFNSPVLPPFFTGYPPHNALPLTFDGSGTPNYNVQASGVPSAGGSSHAVDMQLLNKLYGQGGLIQPSFTGPRMQLHQPFPDLYNISSQVDHLALRTGVIGSQGTGGPRNVHQRRGGMMSPNYFGNSTNMGTFMHMPSSSCASPVAPASLIGGSGLPGGRFEPSFLTYSDRNARFDASWPGQRAFESLKYPKATTLLEELKSGKGRRFELSDITGHVVELSVDQHGSRFIQQKLENCSFEEKASVFEEVLPHASKLMTDVFGNYVIQKFFEYGTPEQRKELANQLAGQILSFSLQMYGCRVIQKALDVIELDQKAVLVRELDGHVMRCVRDQNGNHVIQKCIECIPADKIGFIISAFRGQVAILSMHPYGCRVIQRILEHFTDELQSQFIVDEILDSVCNLAQDQYGNYVIQHVLAKGKPQEQSQIIKMLSGQIVQMSQHKFASNVVEKCLQYGDTAAREVLIGEIVGSNEGNDNLLMMMKDQYANYVVQKILETCTENQRDVLLGRIRVHLHALKKYTYGKHIVARFEQLFGEEIQESVDDWCLHVIPSDRVSSQHTRMDQWMIDHFDSFCLSNRKEFIGVLCIGNNHPISRSCKIEYILRIQLSAFAAIAAGEFNHSIDYSSPLEGDEHGRNVRDHKLYLLVGLMFPLLHHSHLLKNSSILRNKAFHDFGGSCQESFDWGEIELYTQLYRDCHGDWCPQLEYKFLRNCCAQHQLGGSTIMFDYSCPALHLFVVANMGNMSFLEETFVASSLVAGTASGFSSFSFLRERLLSSEILDRFIETSICSSVSPHRGVS